MSTKSRIAQATAQFVAEMEKLLELQLRERLLERLSSPGGGAARPAASSGTARRRGAELAAPERAPRVRRSVADLEAVKEKLLQTIASHPGLSSEELKARLGIPTAALRGPLQVLRSEHKIRTTGQRRDMRYFASGKSGAGRRQVQDDAASAGDPS